MRITAPTFITCASSRFDGTGVDINEPCARREIQRQADGDSSLRRLGTNTLSTLGSLIYHHVASVDRTLVRQEVSNLRELNPDNNMLTSIGGLHKLDKLTVV